MSDESIIPDLHTKNGTAAGPDGNPITNIKLPHVGGHEGVGRIVAIGPGCGSDLKVGGLVGIRFSSRICRRCDFCLAGAEQHCVKSTNHLHHEDGCFQEYIALDADYLTILPDDVDPSVIGPVLCAGVTAYKVFLSCSVLYSFCCCIAVLTSTGCFKRECQSRELAGRRGCRGWAWAFGR